MVNREGVTWCISRPGLLVMAAVLVLAGCAGFGEDAPYTLNSKLAEQPYPDNYRADLLAFMRTYLNDPGAVREASLAAPVQRTVAGKPRFVACLRYTATGQGDNYGGGDRAALFLDGRMERLMEKAGSLCAGVTYEPFPEMQKLKR